jgi:hypothetical protein
MFAKTKTFVKTKPFAKQNYAENVPFFCMFAFNPNRTIRGSLKD